MEVVGEGSLINGATHLVWVIFSPNIIKDPIYIFVKEAMKIINRPGQSQGLLDKHLGSKYLIHQLNNSLAHGLWKYLYGAARP